MDTNDKKIFTNSFGTVSDKDVIISYKNNAEDIPLNVISSVTFERRRNILEALLYFVFGLGCLIESITLKNLPDLMIVFAILAFLLCALAAASYFIGYHIIKLNITGKDGKSIKVKMFKTKEGREFWGAIKKQVSLN